jgi:hypothetical protein
MSKKNKKKNPQQLKAEKAHQKNLYLKRIKEMMNILGCGSAYDLLDYRGIGFFHYFHLRPLKFINPENGLKLPNNDLEQINEHFSHLLKKQFIQVGPEKRNVSYYDFYTLIETIYFFYRNCDKLELPNIAAIKEKLDVFDEDFMDVRNKGHELIEDLIYTLLWSISDLTRFMVWTEYEKVKEVVSITDTSFLNNNYILHIEKPESKMIEMDGITRSVFRVGMIDMRIGLTWFEIIPEKMGIDGILSQMPLKVYIQPHALERVKERLGNFAYGLESTLILTGLIEKITSRTSNGGFLFAIRYLSLKMGYIKADMVGDMLIIRTFLFLTNNGTPEGKKLEELLGVQKEDKQYLGIDKLDTFIHSDIDQNPELKDIFIEAGCGDLFKLKKYIEDEPDSIIRCANYISQYLGLGDNKTTENLLCLED